MTARKGDLIVVECVSHSYAVKGPRTVNTTYRVGVVASATRDGQVKTWQANGYGDQLLSGYPQPIRYDHNWTTSAKEIDVDGALGAAKAHHWEGHPGQPQDFDTLEEVRVALRPFKL